MLEDRRNVFLPQSGPETVFSIQAEADAEAGVANAQLNGPVLMAILGKLHAAQAALQCQGEGVGEYIARAIALLHAELRSSDDSALHTLRAPPLQPQKLTPLQTRKATEFIDRNLHDRICIDDLASISHLSSSYFSKAFRSSFHVSPYTYIIRQRIKRAQEMMVQTEETLASIAGLCGFADQSHMTRIFKRTVGASPASWRRLRRS